MIFGKINCLRFEWDEIVEFCWLTVKLWINCCRMFNKLVLHSYQVKLGKLFTQMLTNVWIKRIWQYLDTIVMLLNKDQLLRRFACNRRGKKSRYSSSSPSFFVVSLKIALTFGCWSCYPAIELILFTYNIIIRIIIHSRRVKLE